MASVIKLKRSSIEGKSPTTSSLELGEIAINTYDGKIYFEKSGSTHSVETIVTTDSTTTGSIELTATGSFGHILKGGVNWDTAVSSSAQAAGFGAGGGGGGSVTQSFSDGTATLISGSIASTGSFGHLMKGGVNWDTAVSSSAQAAGFGSLGGSYVHIQTNPSITWVVTHSLATQFPIVTIYDNNNEVIIPATITADSTNLSTIVFDSPVSGKGHFSGGVVPNVGGYVHTQTSPSITWAVTHSLSDQFPNVTIYDSNNEVIIPATITADSTNLSTIVFDSAVSGRGHFSGGVIPIVGSYVHTQTSTSTNWAVTHSLSAQFLNVTIYDNNDEVIIPATITADSTNLSTIVFDSAVSGKGYFSGGSVVSFSDGTATTISGSLVSTGSFGLVLGDGSQLSNLPASFTSAQISGSFTSTSSSLASRITTEETNVDTLQSTMTSEQTNIDNLQTDSGSFSTRLTTEESNVDTLQSKVGQSLNTTNSPTFDDLYVTGGVIDLKNDGVASVLRLYCESSNAHYTEFKAPAHSAFSGGDVTLTLPATAGTLALTQVGLISGSAQIATQISGSFGNQRVGTTDDVTFASLTTTGDITARNYIVSSSVTHLTQSFSSGSTIFGDSADDTHVFVGDTISGSSTSTGSFGAGYIDNKLGIGITSPGEKLELAVANGSGNVGMRFLQTGQVEYKVGINDSDDKLYITNNNGNSAIGSNSTGIVMTYDGKVGIGTASPEGALHITAGNSGNATVKGISIGTSGDYASIELKGSVHDAGGGFIDFGYPSHDFQGRIIYHNSDDSMVFYTGTSVALTINNSQNTTFAGTIGSGAITSTGLITGTDLSISGTSTTIGTVTSGIWNGTAIASAYLDADTAHLSTTQTFSGAKTFSSTLNTAAITATGNISSSADSTGSFGRVEATIFSGDGSGLSNLPASFTAAQISGSLGPNAAVIRNLSAANVSGSFTAPSSSLASRITIREAFITQSFSDGTAALISGSLISTGSFGHIMKGGINWDTAVSSSAQAAGFGAGGGGGDTVDFGGYKFTQGAAATTWNVLHSLNEQYPNVTVYDSNDEVIIPATITANTVSSSTITFDSAVSGKAHYSGGGNISGSASSTGSFGHVVVGGNLIPSESGSFDLGSSTNPWKDLHIISSSIKMYGAEGEVARLQIGSDNELEFFDVRGLSATQRRTYTPSQIRSTATKGRFRGRNIGTTDDTDTTGSFGQVISAGNISGSSTSTGSFGHIMRGGVNWDTAVSSSAQAAGFGAGGGGGSATQSFSDGTATLISGSSTSTGSFGAGYFAGNVGIGITSPDANLAIVNTNSDYDPALRLRSNSSVSNWARLDILNTNVTDPFILYQNQAGESALRNEHDGGSIQFITKNTTATEKMRITSDGNVGIGPTSPTETLHISGSGTTKLFVEGDISGSATSTGSFGILNLGGGVIDLKNDGVASVLRLYCETNNHHFVEIKAPAHSTLSGNVTLTLPSTTDTIAGIATSQTFTNKTLTTPTIASFTNATHDHADTAGGGVIALGTATSGNYVGTVTGGTGIDSTGATSGEGITHTLSIDSTVTTLAGSQTLTNKTLTSPVINVTSDAEGDIYYRSSGGAFTRLAKGTDNHVLTMNGNVPNWEAASGGGGGSVTQSFSDGTATLISGSSTSTGSFGLIKGDGSGITNIPAGQTISTAGSGMYMNESIQRSITAGNNLTFLETSGSTLPAGRYKGEFGLYFMANYTTADPASWFGIQGSKDGGGWLNLIGGNAHDFRDGASQQTGGGRVTYPMYFDLTAGLWKFRMYISVEAGQSTLAWGYTGDGRFRSELQVFPIDLYGGSALTQSFSDGTAALISGSSTSTGSFGHILKGGVNWDTAVSSSAQAAGFGAGGGGGGASEVFKTISVSGQSDVVADSATDTLTLVAGSNMTLTTSAGGDSVTFASSGGGGGGGTNSGSYTFDQNGAASSWAITHSLGTQYNAITVYDDNDNAIIPYSIVADDSNKTTITFTGAVAGKAVINSGGTVGTVTQISTDGSHVHNQSGASTNWAITHSLNSQYPNVTVYGDNDEVMIPYSIKADSVDLSTITFTGAVTGKAVYSMGGNLSGSAASTGSFGRVEAGSFYDDGTQLNVPDYVFEDEYELKSFSYVENHISQSKHLPGVPSREDMDAWTSYDMGARDMLLLEKIEELSLYIIQLNKRIVRLEKKI